ncbi:hypothetical protein [Prevotella sp. 10(H)]|uniref:hypothetical protein n=1 Tax=Prevotella sp. 10(H) TaxID=1158294 RepID=UPI0004A6CFBE|nr:hypothetical protein [Prevotella sp. 10(H)]
MLDKIDKSKTPFKIPENYFENFNAEMMDKLPSKQTEKAKIVPLWKKVLPWSAAAAMLCGIVFSTGVFKQNATEDPEPVISSAVASSVDEDDYYHFLEDEVARANRFDDTFYSNN